MVKMVLLPALDLPCKISPTSHAPHSHQKVDSSLRSDICSQFDDRSSPRIREFETVVVVRWCAVTAELQSVTLANWEWYSVILCIVSQRPTNEPVKVDNCLLAPAAGEKLNPKPQRARNRNLHMPVTSVQPPVNAQRILAKLCFHPLYTPP